MNNGVLTVEIKADGCIAFAQLIFCSHFVFASILNCDIIYLKWRKILLTFLLINRLLFKERTFVFYRINFNQLFIGPILRPENGRNTVGFIPELHLYLLLNKLTLCRLDSLTGTVLWDHVTDGFGSALMRHSNSSRLPSSSCRMAGFLTNVGATPSICLFFSSNKYKIIKNRII